MAVTHMLRIGARIGTADPYWVQVREAVYQRAAQAQAQLIPIDIGHSSRIRDEEHEELLEELLAQDLDALICAYMPDALALRIVSYGIPVIHLTETDVRHPLCVSPRGFYEIGQMIGAHMLGLVGYAGHVVAVGGGLAQHGEDGRSRLSGLQDLVASYPRARLTHIPSAWRYSRAYGQIVPALRDMRAPAHAIIGLSDSLALAARDALRELGLPRPPIAGINGDPAALSAVAEGSLVATVETSAADLGAQAVDAACRAARGEQLPPHLDYNPRLVTLDNVAEVGLHKLTEIASLPDRLVGVNHQKDTQQLAQLQASLAISQRIGSILDPRQLSHELADIIRASYGYDMCLLFHWRERERTLVAALPDGAEARVDAVGGELPAEALRQGRPIFIADTRHSHRFAPDPSWPQTRSRVLLPIRFGGRLLGLIDLHSRRITQESRQTLAGLQSLADQLGVALRNAELYDEALRARAAAERADLLKTRLLANVSHELRAPLNVILGYSQAALDAPNPYGVDLPPELLRDIQRISASGQHLIRLINDLLDLSRAEIGALDLFPELVDTRAFLAEVFQSATGHQGAGVEYHLDLPPALPAIQADPLRLRQVLLNLLSNAQKFTERGQITLGAELAPPHLHLWVRDTGAGIASDMQGRIFEPFVTAARDDVRPQGIGLGLSITRRLVALHQGTITLESQPGQGSTFHISLPLPSLSGQPAAPQPDCAAVLLLSSAAPPAALAALCELRGLALAQLGEGQDVAAALAQVRPAAIAWDMARAAPADWQIIEQLRRSPQASRLPFLLYGGDEAAPAALGVISKPISGASLAEAIAALYRPEGGRPILIVDDDAQTRAYYAALIARALPGQAVRCVEGGEHALQFLAGELPSLVLLDLMMPDVDGFAVLERIRASERTCQIPVIILSGHMLSRADIQRLDHARVTFHTKGLLSDDELSQALGGELAGRDYLARPTSLVVKRAVGYIQQRYASDLSRQQIADAVGVSKNYLSHIFQQELGISPWEYLNRYRIAQARAMLERSASSISEVAAQVGFEDASYFGRMFRKHVGCSPQAYRSQFG
ncbi:helix-turn-helix domain-containing protein [Chloroflexia bacterium SDU3-3]|nr:helix-turn-helix domain-containing protein [Chloroflexia bacterium SDU3-3]